jgi:hypothetical protein
VCAFVTRWSAPPPTAPAPPTSAGRRTRRSPRDGRRDRSGPSRLASRPRIGGTGDAVADELERSAARAQARGGQAAAAAFLERSADLTLDARRRAGRAPAAAEAMQLAGSADDALRLATAAERGPLDELHRVRVDVLRGKVALAQRRGVEAAPLLLAAARRLEPYDRRLARDTYRDAFMGALFAGSLASGAWMPEVAAAIRAAAPSADPRTPTDELLDAGALLLSADWAAGAPAMRRALAV